MRAMRARGFNGYGDLKLESTRPVALKRLEPWSCSKSEPSVALSSCCDRVELRDCCLRKFERCSLEILA